MGYVLVSGIFMQGKPDRKLKRRKKMGLILDQRLQQRVNRILLFERHESGKDVDIYFGVKI